MGRRRRKRRRRPAECYSAFSRTAARHLRYSAKSFSLFVEAAGSVRIASFKSSSATSASLILITPFLSFRLPRFFLLAVQAEAAPYFDKRASNFFTLALYSHFAHCGREPGCEDSQLGQPPPAGNALSTPLSSPSPFNPNSQSAEHACTRQILAIISALGVTTSFSHRAQFCCLTLTPFAISD